ncbi:MAG: peptide chain release factor 2 [bacterium]|nr:peptide chain release factor 2 [bacterium]
MAMSEEMVKRLQEKFAELQGLIDVEKHKKIVSKLNDELSKPGCWDDNNRAREFSESLSRHQEIVKEIEQVSTEYADLIEFAKLGEPVESEITKLIDKIEEIEINHIFDDEIDTYPALLNIHPGAGGTESCDWVSMLLRMYLRWFERKGFKATIIDYESGDIAGIKNVTIEVKGNNAYGWVKSESGVHRLVRISPFDANSKRHTSFASCFVYPLIEDDGKISIKEEDLKIDTFRSSGAGGQNVNKVSSAIRITHLPTGIVVSCQSERSQFYNKQNAMKVLKSRLYQLKKNEDEKKLAEMTPQKQEISWGMEIRSYVFCPYTMVKDHRTGVESGKLQNIMDGDLDLFVKTWLLKNAKSQQNKTT